MLNNVVTLVLGAGASRPYGFPTGAELTYLLTADLVAKCHKPSYRFFADLVNESTPTLQLPPYTPSLEKVLHGRFKPEAVVEFALDFSTSGLATIDAFLSKNQKYNDIGRWAIAACLTPFEGQERLIPRLERQWYHQFWDQVSIFRESSQKVKEDLINYLTVINFNYDRSFDFYLWKHLKGALGVDDAYAKEVVERVIYHPYGQIGESVGADFSPLHDGLNGDQINKRIETAARGFG